MSKLRYQVLFTLQLPLSMMLMQWITSLMKEVVITYLIGTIMTLNDSIESKRLKLILFSEQGITSNSIGCTLNRLTKEAGVKCDQTGTFANLKSFNRYPEKLRRIKYYDRETNVEFVFLTNIVELSAIEIAILYKNRWQVELFFKWIKQHLKVKSFWGHTPNAVKTQLYCAIIAYCLVAIIGKELKISRSTYEILQILGISLLDKTPVKELFANNDYKNVKEPKL